MEVFFCRLKDVFYHFRFYISFAFLPIFLWGYAITEADISENFFIGLFALHFMIYPGLNGIYAYFDRGGKSIYKEERNYSAFTFVVASLIFIFGIYLATKVNEFYLFAVSASVVLFSLFAFPFTGIKKKAFYSLLFIGLSIGFFTFTAGWACAIDLKNSLDLFYLGGAVSSFGFAIALYSLSLIYRLSENSVSSGDLFIEKMGFVKVFRLIKTTLLISTLVATIVFAGKFTLYELVGIIVYFLIGLFVLEGLEKNFYLQKELQNYKVIVRINVVNSVVLSSYLLFRILAVSYSLI